MITLSKYQEIDAIMADGSLDETDRTLYCMCVLYGYKPEELNREDPFKVLKLSQKIPKLFKFNFISPKFIGKYKINYDVDSITFGQYIELSYFFQFNNVDKANYIVASLAKGLRQASHPDKANYFLKCSVNKVIGAMAKIREGFVNLNSQFKDLFNLDPDVNAKAKDNSFMVQFNKVYGWLYSAEVVADYEKITLEEVYRLPARRALKGLVYLKAKEKYNYYNTKK
jgi:hypothetical protein